MGKNRQSPTYFELVYAITQQIPVGRVTTYGAIADYLSLGSARMVGWALRHVEEGDAVPAHRVLNRNGELSGRGHFSPPELMQQNLESEGLHVENDRVCNFASVFWHPAQLDESDFFTI
jgi:methylated-DNA-protein-cysteine methyltransferase-like protein